MIREVGDLIDVNKDIVIYGAGNDGIQTFITLLNQGIYVKYFCDSDKSKQDIKIMNKKVISPKELLAMKDNCQIIIGSREYYNEIYNKLREQGFNQIFSYSGHLDNFISIGDRSINRFEWYSLLKLSYSKKIIIYGTDSQGNDLERKLKLTDIKIDCFIDDSIDLCKGNKDVKAVYDLLAEDIDNRMVIVTDKMAERYQKLKGLGLLQGVNFQLLNHISNISYTGRYSSVVDVNLGYTFINSEPQFPGYTVYGEEISQIKIVTLGGSTTDPGFNSFKSWPELLYQKLNKCGKSVKIYNGGISGYNAQQELIKLIRDMPVIKPNIILDLSGVNNFLNKTNYDEEFPFTHPYYHVIFNNIRNLPSRFNDSQQAVEIYNKKNKKDIVFGIEREIPDKISDAAQNYQHTVKMMNAVCQALNIKFISFFQPTLWYKKDMLSLQEREMFMHFVNEVEQRGLMRLGCQFRNEVINNIGLEKYQIDISGIFDNFDDVYVDRAHVRLEGNEVIAQTVLHHISDML